MKNLSKYSPLLIGLLSISYNTLQADDDLDITTQNFSAEQITDISKEAQDPYRISVHGDWIGPSKIDKRHHHHQHVKYYNVEVQGETTVYYNPDCKEGLGVAAGYNNARFDWKQNPYFSCKTMNQVFFTVTGFSARLQNWLWQGQATVNWEPKYKNFQDYTNYDLVLWGRYSYSSNVNLHIGFIAQTGMKIDHIFPIFGIDWKFCDKWMLNAVLPVNVSLVYQYDKCWSASVAARVFDIRYRFGKHEHLQKALLQYYNLGTEFTITFSKGAFYANVHGGMTVWGQFRVSDSNNKHKKHFDIDPAPYVGGEVAVKF